MTIRIKNCGLRTETDVHAAITSGAHFIGFVIHSVSVRHVEPSHSASLASALPEAVASVAVMVSPDEATLSATLNQWRPDYLQLHGDIAPDRLHQIRQHSGLKLIRAIAIASAEDVQKARTQEELADHLLLDTKHLDLQGGTGQCFDWTLLRGVSFRKPWFVSGGLNRENIHEALKITGAPMVDVSSGIESSRGVKDPQKIITFNQHVRHYHP